MNKIKRNRQDGNDKLQKIPGNFSIHSTDFINNVRQDDAIEIINVCKMGKHRLAQAITPRITIKLARGIRNKFAMKTQGLKIPQ